MPALADYFGESVSVRALIHEERMTTVLMVVGIAVELDIDNTRELLCDLAEIHAMLLARPRPSALALAPRPQLSLLETAI